MYLTAQEQADYRRIILADLQTSQTACHLFVCNLRHINGGTVLPHWILIAVVKLNGRRVMIVLDSYNIVIDNQSDAAQCIEFLYRSFIDPRVDNN